jgi:hypothetical protein
LVRQLKNIAPHSKKSKSATDADEDEDVALLRASQAEQRAEQLQYNLSATCA